jgi:hypothetical protein
MLLAAGALAGGALVVVTSLELQLDKPRALSKPTTTRVSAARPGVQKDFPARADWWTDFFTEAIKFLLS